MIPLGFAVGALGTLIGAGGGFVLVPILIFLYPGDSTETITSISLAVVAANGLAGSWAYAKKGRIHYPSAWSFTLAAVPGALLGAWLTAQIPRQAFERAFGLVMVLGGLYLMRREAPEEHTHGEPGPGETAFELVEVDGTRHAFAYDTRLGAGISAGVGLVAVMLGIGGGIIHVPFLSFKLGFPVHVATATSHLVLGLTAALGTAAHCALGAFEHGLRRAALLSLGAVLGAQLGAALSDKVKGSLILKALAFALALVGVRLLLR